MADLNKKYMLNAIKLAQRGIGSVEPNPPVGCLLVKGNQIVGKGFHEKFGGPHAEINALNDCKVLGVNPQGAAMFVTLEPCCHLGKTPPCTDAIISAGITRVYVATIDPAAHNAGKGIATLREAGIYVESGTCQEEAQILAAPFIKFAKTQIPWVTLKWAQSIDGKVAWDRTIDRRWISNELSRKDVQKLRRRSQAILVGINTVIDDDPLLTARPPREFTLTRIVLDTHLSIPTDCKLIKTISKSPVLIVTSDQAIIDNQEKAEQLLKLGAQILPAPLEADKIDIAWLLQNLGQKGVTQLLVEGGPQVITSFLERQLADEICVYIAPTIMGPLGFVDITKNFAYLPGAFSLKNIEIKPLEGDIRLSGHCDW